MGFRNNRRGRGRGDRARAVTAILAALVVTIAIGTKNAYADVAWHDQNNTDVKHAAVWPYDYDEYNDTGRCGALAEFLGYNWDSLSQQVKNSIVTDNNGDNAFTALLNSNDDTRPYYICNMQYESAGGLMDWPILNIGSQIFGLDKMWEIRTTTGRYEDAQAVMKKYMFPNDGGNTGGGGGSGDGYVMPDSYTLLYNNDGLNVGETITVNLNSTAKSIIEQYINGTNIENKLVYSSAYFYRGYLNTVSIVCVDANLFHYGTYNGHPYCLIKNDGTSQQYVGKKFIFSYSNNVCNATNANDITISTGDGIILHGYACLISGNEVSDPYVPTPDPTPTKPTIQIGDVTIDLSNGPYTVNNTTYSVVYAPDNSWSVSVETHTDNQYGGDVTATDPTDYTSILNAILSAINQLRNELNTIGNSINANLTTLNNNLSNSIKSAETELKGVLHAMQQQQHQDMQTLQTNLQNGFNTRMDAFADDLWANMAALDSDIIDELDAVAKYIVDSMDFGSAFSDKDIISWLKRIYTRLGSKPVIKNPTEDPTGWFDDLKDLLEMILGTALAGVDTAALSTLWNTAKTHFPLSLPWDMLAIVGLLAHEPITPAVDYPIVYDGTTIAEIEFDLSEYEDVAEVSRKMSLIVFAMGFLITYPQIFHTLEPLTKALRG